MVEIMNLLKAGDTPAVDQKTFLKSQILFWLIGATDGHAKNVSIFLGAGGRFHLTPLYDVLTAQPSLDDRQIERKQMKLAMSVGDSRHYKIEEIRGGILSRPPSVPGCRVRWQSVPWKKWLRLRGRHPESRKGTACGFLVGIHNSVKKALKSRLQHL